jgi:transcriptional regulator with XRE-family HTH domain
MAYIPRFKDCRLAAGLTQQEAAGRLGKTTSAIQKWEAGTNSPTMEDIRRLADAYQVEPTAFFQDDSLLTEGSAKNFAVVLDTNAILALAANERHRILSQLKECGEALPRVPKEFADHWIEGLKACASIVVAEARSEPRQCASRHSAKTKKLPTPKANEVCVPSTVRQRRR